MKDLVGANGIRTVRQGFVQYILFVKNRDRSSFNALANRVNTIAPYEILRHPKTICDRKYFIIGALGNRFTKN